VSFTVTINCIVFPEHGWSPMSACRDIVGAPVSSTSAESSPSSTTSIINKCLQTSLCPGVKLSSQWKHWFLRQSDLRRREILCRCECIDEADVVEPATVAPELAIGVHGFTLNWLADLPDEVPCATTIVECCSYAQANATAWSRVRGCFSATSVRRGSPRPVVKSCICYSSVRV
jgi:hypothetical protein